MKKPTRVLTSASLILFLLVPACGGDQQPEAGQGLADGDPEMARRLVAEEGALLLDVRTPEEYGEESAEGAVNIPVQELPARLGEVTELLGGEPERPIVVYCRSGRRAAAAKEILLKAGFGRVTNLGGLAEWTGPHTSPQP